MVLISVKLLKYKVVSNLQSVYIEILYILSSVIMIRNTQQYFRMHKEIQIDDFECMKDQRVERLLRNYIVQHGRRPKSILMTNKHGTKMHIKSRALSPSPKSPIRYIEIQNQDFGTVIDSLTKETEEPTVQFDEFMKGVDTSNLLVVCNSKTNLSEPSTMIKPKYTSVETKKIDFNSNEAKTKMAAKTHRGMTSKYFKNSEKKDFGDSKIIDIVAHNNLVVQNFNNCLKTASTGNIKIIDQDLNQLFGNWVLKFVTFNAVVEILKTIIVMHFYTMCILC